MAKVNGDSDLLPCSLLFSTLQLHSTTEQEMEERKCNYERYRGLVQNDFASSKSHTITRCLSPSFPYKRSFDGKMLHKQVKKNILFCRLVSEEQCLYQIYLDELYGGLQKPNEEEKKKYVCLRMETDNMICSYFP